MLAVNPRATWSWPQKADADTTTASPTQQQQQSSSYHRRRKAFDVENNSSTSSKNSFTQSQVQFFGKLHTISEKNEPASKIRRMSPELQAAKPSKGYRQWKKKKRWFSNRSNLNCISTGVEPVTHEPNPLMQIIIKDKEAQEEKHGIFDKFQQLLHLKQEDNNNEGGNKRKSTWYSSFGRRKKAKEDDSPNITVTNVHDEVTQIEDMELSKMTEKSLKIEDVSMDDDSVVHKRNKCFQSPRIGSDISQDSGLGDEMNSEHQRHVSESSTLSQANTEPYPLSKSSSASSYNKRSFESPLATSTMKKPNLKPNINFVSSYDTKFTATKPVVETKVVKAKILKNTKGHRPAINRQSISSVSSQWDSLCREAEAQVLKKLLEQKYVFEGDNCDSKMMADRRVVSMIFRQQMSKLELLSSSEIGHLMDTVYRVLFFDWIGLPFDSIIVHCAQKFLIAIVDVCCTELEIDERLRLAKEFKNLLTTSEQSGYKDLKTTLKQTQVLYIQLWCALLCVPFQSKP